MCSAIEIKNEKVSFTYNFCYLHLLPHIQLILLLSNLLLIRSFPLVACCGFFFVVILSSVFFFIWFYFEADSFSFLPAISLVACLPIIIVFKNFQD